MNKKLSFPKSKIRILLLEAIHPAAVDAFKQAGYKVEQHTAAFTEKQLLEVIPEVHILGIRSKSEITEKVLRASKHLLSVGCFCIGTNQVNLKAAAENGVSVFNAPFSNTRSVAELTIAEIVMLARKAAHKNIEMHKGVWNKSADGCVEVRNKTIGIIGYGHIGPQVGLLAEAFGMKVLFYDISNKLPLGNAVQVPTLKELLKVSDFVTLHVPENPGTINMISKKEIAQMKKGACLLNLSRGSIVDIPALRDALLDGHLGGAAADVFPVEPNSNKDPFRSELCGLENVILTPHVGGSTYEAQKNIGIEVASALIKYCDTGTSSGSVNFPQVDLPILSGSHRVLNIHKNVPGVLSQITRIVADMGGNIKSQFLSTLDDVGYLIMDLDQELSLDVKKKIESMDANIRTRLLF